MGGLGQTAAPTSAPASNGLLSPTQFCSTSCNNAAFVAFLQTCIATRFLPDDPIVGGAGTGSAGCPTKAGSTGAATAAKVSKVGSSIAGTVGGVTAALAHAGSFAGIFATGGALSAIPIVGAIAAAALGVVAVIEAHHAQAEAVQSSTLCTNVPVANALLAQVDQELADGTASPQDAQTAYQNMLTQFVQSMQMDPSYKKGDAMWGYVQGAQACLAQRMQDLNNGILTSGAPGSWAAGTVGTTATALGLPPAALYIGLGLLAWWLL
jgi:hypothetical protein